MRIFTQNTSNEDYHEAIINYANGDVLSGAGGSITTNYHFTPQFGATNQVSNSLFINTSTDFNINYMYSGYVDSNNLENNPLGSDFAGIRHIYVDGQKRVVVEIIETYPMPGRKWYACYTQGSGWTTAWNYTNPSKTIADQGTSGIWKYTRYADNYKVCFATTGVSYVNGNFCVGTFTLPFTISNGTALASVDNIEYSDIAISQLMAAAAMISNNQVRVIIGNGSGGFEVGTNQMVNIVVAGF